MEPEESSRETSARAERRGFPMLVWPSYFFVTVRAASGPIALRPPILGQGAERKLSIKTRENFRGS